MTRQVLYRYLGTNGVLETPIHLEDVYYVRRIALTAAPGKILTNGVVRQTYVNCSEDEEVLWSEVEDDLE